jgi:hypothetical protein
MARWLVGVVACSIARTSLASADPAPEPTPAPPATSWYSAAAPAPASADRHVRHTVQRGGVFVLAGLTRLDATAYGRVDLGFPAPLRSAPRMRAILVSELSYGTDADMTLNRNLALTPELQYEWRLPFGTERGEVFLTGAAGLRRATLWVKRPDEPFWPSTWESTTAYALRVSGGIEYRGQSGLVIAFQPLSAGIPLNTPKPPDARYPMTKPETNYAMSIVAGYQFQ